MMFIVIEAEQKAEEAKDPRKKLLRLIMKAKVQRQKKDVEDAFASANPSSAEEVAETTGMKEESGDVKQEEIPA